MDWPWLAYGRCWFAAPSDTAFYRRLFQFFAENYQNTVLVDLSDLRDPVLGPAVLRMAAQMGLHVLAYTNDTTPLRPAALGLTLQSPEWQAFLGYRWGFPDRDEPPPLSAAMAAALKAPDPTKIIVVTTLQQVATWFPPLPAAPVADYLAGEGYSLPQTYYTTSNDVSVMAPYYSLRALKAAGIPTFWSMGYAWGGPGGLPQPTDVHLRKMAMWTPLMGGTGTLWWHWSLGGKFEDTLSARYSTGHDPPDEPSEVEAILKTPRYHRIGAINHYMADVVGPAVMGGTYLGQYHDTCCMICSNPEQPIVYCMFSETVPNYSTTLPGEQRELIYSLGAHTMAGVYRFVAGTDTSYTLLVGNRSETPINTTVTLKGHTHLEVGLAPPIAGYEAPAGFAPVPTAFSRAAAAGYNDSLTTFTLSLESLEVRVLRVHRLTPATHFAALLSPKGGEIWQQGEPRTISWTGLASNIRVSLYVDRVEAPGLVGPSVTLASPPANATSCTIVVPSVISTRAHLEVSGVTPAGTTVRLNHQTPIRVTSAGAEVLSPTRLQTTTGYVFSDLTTAENGTPRALAMTEWNGLGLLRYYALGSGVWSASRVLDGRCLPAAGPSTTQGTGAHGIFPTLRVSSNGTTHVAYFSLFHAPTPLVARRGCPTCDLDSTGQVLRYQRKVGTSWTRETVDWVGTAYGGCAMALDTLGEPFVAYNSGPWGRYSLRLKHRVGGVWKRVADSHDDVVGAGPADDLLSHASAIDLVLARDEFSKDAVFAAIVSRRTGETRVSKVNLQDLGSGTGWQFTLAIPNGGLVKLVRAPDGFPAVVYTTPGASPKSSRIWFRKLGYFAPTGSYAWLFPELVDGGVMRVSGLAVTYTVDRCVVAYAANGALLESARDVDGRWTQHVRDVSHAVDGPVSVTSNASGDRWYSYWDRRGDALLVASLPSGGGGLGVDADLSRRGESITLLSPNPVRFDGRLVFGLELSEASDFRAELMDVGGRRIARQPGVRLGPGVLRQEWRVGGSLSPGVYFLRAWLGNRLLLNRRVVAIR